MLFFVMSDPYFAGNKEVDPARKQFKEWIDDLKSQKVIQTYHKMGKGSNGYDHIFKEKYHGTH